VPQFEFEGRDEGEAASELRFSLFFYCRQNGRKAAKQNCLRLNPVRGVPPPSSQISLGWLS